MHGVSLSASPALDPPVLVSLASSACLLLLKCVRAEAAEPSPTAVWCRAAGTSTGHLNMCLL